LVSVYANGDQKAFKWLNSMYPNNQQKIESSSAKNETVNNAYANREFWAAYAALLYSSPSDLKKNGFTKLIEDLLRKRAGESGDFRVLCLGMGCGTFDFPILHVLENCRRQVAPYLKLKVLGIDAYAAPMAAVAALFPRLVDASFPATAPAYSRAITKNWCCDEQEKFVPWKGDEFSIPRLIDSGWRPWEEGFVCQTSDGNAALSCCVCDLDFLEAAQEKDGELSEFSNHQIFKHFPSEWAHVVRKKMGINETGNDGFDLVISAFCLHHLFWRRVTILQTVSLLKESGALLLGTMRESDALAFQGIYNSNENNQEQKRILYKICDSLFGKLSKGKSEAFIRSQMQTSGAHLQTEVTDLLYRVGLVTKQADQDNVINVDYANDVPGSAYADIIETCGLTPIRDLHRIFESTGEWLSLLCEFKKYANEKDTFHCSMKWYGFSFPENDKNRVVGHPITKKFNVFSKHSFIENAHTNRDFNTDAFFCNEYEMMEAHAVATSTSAVTRELFMGSAAKNFVLECLKSGLFRKDMVVGAMAAELSIREHAAGIFCFVNPIGCRTRSEDDSNGHIHLLSNLMGILGYLLLKRFSFPAQEYTNSNILLENILPLFPLPVVFHYQFHLRGAGRKDDHFRFELHRYRTFYEIVLETPPNTIYDQSRWGISGDIFVHLEKLKIENASYLKTGNSLLVDLPKDIHSIGSELEEYAKHEVRAISKNIEEDSFGNFLSTCRRTLPQSSVKSIEAVFKGVIEDGKTIWRCMLETMYILARIQNCNDMVIYPATAWDSGIQQFVSDDSIILCYNNCADDTRCLNSDDIRHEYRKIDAIFQVFGMKKSAAKAFGRLRSVHGHELAKIYSGAISASEQCSRKSDKSEAQCFFISNTTKAALKYGMLWAKSRDLILPKEVYLIIDDCGNTWEKYAKTLLNESWQIFLGANVVFDDGGTITKEQNLLSRVNELWNTKDFSNQTKISGQYKFSTSIKEIQEKRFINDLFMWFMVGLTNVWKHLILTPAESSGKPLCINERISEAEKFLGENNKDQITLKAYLDKDGATVFEIINKYSEKNDSQPPRIRKTGMALHIASEELRTFLKEEGQCADRFEGVANEGMWYTTLSLRNTILEQIE